MKKARFFLTILLASVFVLSSCDEEASPKTYFDKYTAELSYLGGVVEATVISNGAWAITSNHDGVVVTPSEGYGDTPIVVEVPENTENLTYAVRILATTTIGDNSYTNRLAIALGARPFVVCEENEATVSAVGGTARFFVNSNYPWSVVESVYGDGSKFDGTIVPSKWDRNGVQVNVNVPANTTGTARIVTIKLQLDSYSFATEQLFISQSE